MEFEWNSEKKEVLVIRHGFAGTPDVCKFPDDSQRPLTHTGKKKTEQALVGLLKLIEGPELVVSSPYVRAMETAEIFVQLLGFSRRDILPSDLLLPDENPYETLRFVGSLRASRVAVVGHNPNLSRMAQVALGAPAGSGISLRKAGAALLRKHTATPEDQWDLRWLTTAKLLRLLAVNPP